MRNLIIAFALALAVVNVVPVVGGVRLNHDVQVQWNYCITVEDPQTPQFCDPAAVRLNVETRPGTW
jgi:hypothetical protein